MFIPGYVYKNKKTSKQIIPMSCGMNEIQITIQGYELKEKNDNTVILTDTIFVIKIKEFNEWEQLYEYFKHS